jgi:hypothetical protein
MPISKARTKQAGLVKQVAALLGISESVVYLDIIGSEREICSCGGGSFKCDTCPEAPCTLLPPRVRRSTVRIWTGNMDEDEKARLRSKKEEVKALAAPLNTKIAMSDRHPLGNHGQVALESRRRAWRGKASKRRKEAREAEAKT